jgi:uncharacterized protein (UPF0333 family)
MKKISKNIKKIWVDERGEILLEYGLLIGLAIIIFIILITTVNGIYDWVQENVLTVFEYFQ